MFKDSLTKFINTIAHPVAQTRTLKVEALAESFDNVVDQRPAKPSRTIFEEVINSAIAGSLDNVPRRDIARVCSWYFPEIVDLDLAENIIKELMSYAKERGSTSLYKSLLIGALATLDSKSTALALVLNPFERAPSLAGRRWSERIRTYNLLSKPFGQRHADILLSIDSQSAREDFITSSGLKIFRSEGLGARVFERLSKALYDVFVANVSEAEMAEVFTIWKEFSCDRDVLRFASRYAVPTSAVLLRPWREVDPPKVVKEEILTVLLESFGDPRQSMARWAGVAEQDVMIVRRWLAADSFDIFIRVISEIAKDSHWRQRRAFWSWYLDEGRVHDVWVVCGSLSSHRMQQINRQSQNTRRLQYGELKGASNDQSVLLMRIKNLTVAEWSHNGSVRFWLANNHLKPELFQPEYQGTNVRAHSDSDVRHVGEWYENVSHYIEQHTGIARPRFYPQ